MNYELELNKLKSDLDKAKNLKYQAEARLEELRRQEAEIISELKELNIEPKNLESEIESLEESILKLIAEAKSNLPSDI